MHFRTQLCFIQVMVTSALLYVALGRETDQDTYNQEIAYTVLVYTGMKFGAGTDAEVRLQMIGPSNMTSPDIILHNGDNNFEHGGKDTFSLKTDFIGPVCSVTVSKNDKGFLPDWELEKAKRRLSLKVYSWNVGLSYLPRHSSSKFSRNSLLLGCKCSFPKTATEVVIIDNRTGITYLFQFDRWVTKRETSNTTVTGAWGEWSRWTSCTCGKRLRHRRRTCSNPPPQCGGKKCRGEKAQRDKCPKCTTTKTTVTARGISTTTSIMRTPPTRQSTVALRSSESDKHDTIVVDLHSNNQRKFAFTMAMVMPTLANKHKPTKVSFATTPRPRPVDKHDTIVVDLHSNNQRKFAFTMAMVMPTLANKHKTTKESFATTPRPRPVGHTYTRASSSKSAPLSGLSFKTDTTIVTTKSRDSSLSHVSTEPRETPRPHASTEPRETPLPYVPTEPRDLSLPYAYTTPSGPLLSPVHTVPLSTIKPRLSTQVSRLNPHRRVNGKRQMRKKKKKKIRKPNKKKKKRIRKPYKKKKNIIEPPEFTSDKLDNTIQKVTTRYVYKLNSSADPSQTAVHVDSSTGISSQLEFTTPTKLPATSDIKQQLTSTHIPAFQTTSLLLTTIRVNIHPTIRPKTRSGVHVNIPQTTHPTGKDVSEPTHRLISQLSYPSPTSQTNGPVGVEHQSSAPLDRDKDKTNNTFTGVTQTRGGAITYSHHNISYPDVQHHTSDSLIDKDEVPITLSMRTSMSIPVDVRPHTVLHATRARLSHMPTIVHPTVSVTDHRTSQMTPTNNNYYTNRNSPAYKRIRQESSTKRATVVKTSTGLFGEFENKTLTTDVRRTPSVTSDSIQTEVNTRASSLPASKSDDVLKENVSSSDVAPNIYIKTNVKSQAGNMNPMIDQSVVTKRNRMLRVRVTVVIFGCVGGAVAILIVTISVIVYVKYRR